MEGGRRMFFTRRDDKIEALRGVPLFEALSKRDLNLVARHADEVECEPGEVLVRQGAVGQEFVLIVEGQAKVERDGKVLAHIGGGDFFGEMALLDGKGRSATVTVEKPSKLLVIPSQAFNTLLDEVPGLQRKMLVTLSERIRELQKTVVG
jgi:CRP/FNR family transcriptional regulator, cyclic AMP receptor protein